MTEENIYVKHFRKRLLTKMATELNRLLDRRDSDDYNNYDDPSYHQGWYEAKIQSMNSIINMVKESK